MQFAFELDVSGGLRALRATTDEAKKAIPRALNKTATAVVARGSRAVRDDAGFNIKIGDIKKAMVVTKATENPSVTITARGKPLPLIYFASNAPSTIVRSVRKMTRADLYGGVQKKHARLVRVRVKGQSVALRHAFYATLKSGHVGIFSRQVKGTISKRLPIAEMFGPSIRAAIENKAVVAIMEATARAVFAKNIEHEMEYVVSKR